MLKLNFKPIFATIPKKLKISTLPLSVSSSLQSVRENVSNNLITSINPLSPPTSAYIHLPFCRKRCHYCDFPIVALGSMNQFEDDPRIINYVQLICREIKATKPISTTNPPLETLFFGGGTPSLVPPKLVSSIIQVLKENFGVCSNAEISIEMDPGTFDEMKMRELLELGVNRVSLGVQAFQQELLKKCGRAHGLEEVHDAIGIVKSSGLENWSLDLISSLPHQTLEMWEESLELAVKASPTHVSVYDLQVEQGTKFGNLYTPGEFPLPSETQSAEFYKMASKTLSKAGYEHYEISSYCKKGYTCKHNVTYWQNRAFYGFGLGSASYLGGMRFSRPKKMKEYMGYVQDLEDGDKCPRPVKRRGSSFAVFIHEKYRRRCHNMNRATSSSGSLLVGENQIDTEVEERQSKDSVDKRTYVAVQHF
ncbi:hypothetical protein IFM89_029122 [Coptis chinensis]|uniref:Radical S-adenosyl methionine domain-containing protein 1, mitochondrial n=1 Tax=Coptis chinensis TaxID=261450 RepID=A0A835ITB3_9MAGN|nr:hypothetical protein IFM89_029122 [Coptis chinensis]